MEGKVHTSATAKSAVLVTPAAQSRNGKVFDIFGDIGVEPAGLDAFFEELAQVSAGGPPLGARRATS